MGQVGPKKINTSLPEPKTDTPPPPSTSSKISPLGQKLLSAPWVAALYAGTAQSSFSNGTHLDYLGGFAGRLELGFAPNFKNDKVVFQVGGEAGIQTGKKDVGTPDAPATSQFRYAFLAAVVSAGYQFLSPTASRRYSLAVVGQMGVGLNLLTGNPQLLDGQVAVFKRHPGQTGLFGLKVELPYGAVVGLRGYIFGQKTPDMGAREGSRFVSTSLEITVGYDFRRGLAEIMGLAVNNKSISKSTIEYVNGYVKSVDEAIAKLNELLTENQKALATAEKAKFNTDGTYRLDATAGETDGSLAKFARDIALRNAEAEMIYKGLVKEHNLDALDPTTRKKMEETIHPQVKLLVDDIKMTGNFAAATARDEYLKELANSSSSEEKMCDAELKKGEKSDRKTISNCVTNLIVNLERAEDTFATLKADLDAIINNPDASAANQKSAQTILDHAQKSLDKIKASHKIIFVGNAQHLIADAKKDIDQSLSEARRAYANLNLTDGFIINDKGAITGRNLSKFDSVHAQTFVETAQKAADEAAEVFEDLKKSYAELGDSDQKAALPLVKEAKLAMDKAQAYADLTKAYVEHMTFAKEALAQLPADFYKQESADISKGGDLEKLTQLRAKLEKDKQIVAQALGRQTAVAEANKKFMTEGGAEVTGELTSDIKRMLTSSDSDNKISIGASALIKGPGNYLAFHLAYEEFNLAKAEIDYARNILTKSDKTKTEKITRQILTLIFKAINQVEKDDRLGSQYKKAFLTDLNVKLKNVRKECTSKIGKAACAKIEADVKSNPSAQPASSATPAASSTPVVPSKPLPSKDEGLEAFDHSIRRGNAICDNDLKLKSKYDANQPVDSSENVRNHSKVSADITRVERLLKSAKAAIKTIMRDDPAYYKENKATLEKSVQDLSDKFKNLRGFDHIIVNYQNITVK